jgi:hypothetical protein
MFTLDKPKPFVYGAGFRFSVTIPPLIRPSGPQPLKHVRYPWGSPREKLMTIGIGVLCSTQPKPRAPKPDALVLVADTKVSTETDSLDELHKVFIDEESRFYGVCAGRIEKGADLIPIIKKELAELPKRSHGTFLQALNRAANNHRTQHFHYDVLGPRYMVVPGQVLDSHNGAMLDEFQAYDVGAQLLLGIFDDDGQAFLYYIGSLHNQPGLVHLFEFPGYFAIGSGSYNATFWLNNRYQTLGGNIKRSAYHAYEANRMATRAPTVNDNIELVIATASQCFHLHRECPNKDGCPVSLTELDALWESHKARDTSTIGL